MKRETKCPEYLIMRRVPSAGIYEVFSGPEECKITLPRDLDGGCTYQTNIDKEDTIHEEPQEKIIDQHTYL